MKKKCFYILLLITIFLGAMKIYSFASDDNISGYKLYEQRVENICSKYKPNKEIYNGLEKYEEIGKNLNEKEIENNIGKSIPFGYIFDKNFYSEFIDNVKAPYSFPKAKSIYKKNMNNIYKCMIINSQLASYNLINNDLISNNPQLKKAFGNKITNKISDLNNLINKTKCNNLNDEKNSFQKLNLLKQTSYELCKYHSYLEYVKEKNSNYNNNIIVDGGNDITYLYIPILNKAIKYEGNIDIKSFTENENKINNEINNEIEHIYKVYPIAFNAYKQYENNLTIHLFLELIKQDYITLRQELHNSINPINQVVYKIANAMKK